VTVAIGLAVAQAAGAIEVDGDLITAAALALAWFVVGYAFYACAFACAGALVPRQEELQWEIVASLVVTIGASVALIPLAARIYEGGILRTGSALKLREAWRAARA
jgi:hypothetical protein